jgi:hypothetical protein
MSTMPKNPDQVKPARQPRPRPPLMLDAYVLKIAPAGGHPGCMLLTISSPGRRKGVVDTTAYVLATNPSGEGLAYRLTKLTATGALAGEVYDVLLTIADDDLRTTGAIVAATSRTATVNTLWPSANSSTKTSCNHNAHGAGRVGRPPSPCRPSWSLCR